MRFDLADLSLFRHVVDAGSITHGAERANLALAAASTRIRNMEDALGAALLVRGRQGVQPTQAGRTLLQHARTILRQADRLREDLGAYAGGLAGQIRVLSNTNALTEFLPGGAGLVPGIASAGQHRSRGAAERRDRRPDRRGRRRPRHRRRHRRRERARNLSVPQGSFRAGGAARPSHWPSARRFRSRRCSTTISSGSTARARSQRFLADKAARIGQPLRLRVQLRSSTRSAGWSSARSASALVPETTARRCRAHHGDRHRRPWSMPGRCANSPSASGDWRSCRPTRGNWSSTCAAAADAARGGGHAFHMGRQAAELWTMV